MDVTDESLADYKALPNPDALQYTYAQMDAYTDTQTTLTHIHAHIHITTLANRHTHSF